jgi:hypothetical protein
VTSNDTPPGSTHAGLPGTKRGDINASAWLIYETVKTSPTFKTSNRAAFDSIPGYLWRGSVNQIINRIWPAMTNETLCERDKADEIKVALNRYLRNSRNLVCRERVGPGRLATWWVSEYWSEVTVTGGKTDLASTMEPIEAILEDEFPPIVGHPTADVFAITEEDVIATVIPSVDASPKTTTVATVSDDTPRGHAIHLHMERMIAAGPYPCRFDGCESEPFSRPNNRARHEWAHGLVFDSQGNRRTFDPKDGQLDDDQVEALVLSAMKWIRHQMSMVPLVDAVLKLDARSPKQTIMAAIRRMVTGSQPTLVQVRTGSYTGFWPAQKPLPEGAKVISGEVIADDVEIDEMEEMTVIETPATVDEVETTPKTGLTAAHSLAFLAQELTRLLEIEAQHTALLVLLPENPEELIRSRDDLRLEVESLRAKLATTKLELGSAKAHATEELQAQLEKMTADRDRLATRLREIRRNLLGDED